MSPDAAVQPTATGPTATGQSTSTTGSHPLRILVLVKWLDLHPEFDPITGRVDVDPNRSGLSEADQSAVEVALRIAETHRRGGHESIVGVVLSGPEDANDIVGQLRACGADQVIRAPIPAESSSVNTAQLLLACAHDLLGPKIDLVLTGASSIDRGSGAVPAFIASETNIAQALGVVAVEEILSISHDADLVGRGVQATLLRRLDGGRRERLHVELPAVVSVEGGVHWYGESVRMRRAPLSALLAAQREPVREWSTTETGHVALLSQQHGEQQYLPWRPRALELSPPAGERALDRIVELTGAHVEHRAAQTVSGEAKEMARVIVDQLTTWGYLQPGSDRPRGADVDQSADANEVVSPE